MLRNPAHLSDQELLLISDGEASRRRSRQARLHLQACWVCRSRLAELERTIADFVSLHRRSVSPPAAGPRALLKARLSQAAVAPKRLPLLSLHRPSAYACLGLLLALLGGAMLAPRGQVSITTPDPRLTPGATRPVSLGDVCSMRHEEVVRPVSGWLRDQVFREYGIVNPKPQDYEIDYLIAPGLGGADDIHNLWPEPAVSAKWNARDKDALEERLHQMVCAGELDLPTAQKAIASDWIRAYKRYLPKAT